VVLGKVQDIQQVFNYFDVDGKGLIDYKKFSNETFQQSRESRVQSGQKSKSLQQNKNVKITSSSSNRSLKDPYFENFHNLLKKTGAKGFINLCKEFKVRLSLI
jgi:hypothetical protein